VKLTQKYFQYLGENWNGSVIPQCQPGDKTKPHASKIMSYTNAKEDLHHVLELVGIDPKGYAEHSMKRGGATEAAKNGATADDIQIAGDWAQRRTAALYIDQPTSKNQILRQFLG
jgi:hypothetical protein